LGLPYERIAAFDGRALPKEDFENFCAARPMEGSGDSYTAGTRKWNPASMGCFLSHYESWKRIAEGPDEYAAVFEDDIYISKAIVPLLSSTNWIPANCDIIKLEISYNRIKTGASAAEIGGRSIRPVIPSPYDHCWPVCNGALIISRKTARKLIDTGAKDHMLADIFLFACKESAMARTLNIYQVCPAVCVQDKFLHKDQSKATFKSNIENPAGTKSASNLVKTLTTKMIALLRTLQGYRKIQYQE
jgi:glycosyl transferase family 25